MKKKKLKKRIAELEVRVCELEDRSLVSLWSTFKRPHPAMNLQDFAKWTEDELLMLKKQICELEKETDPAATTTESGKSD